MKANRHWAGFVSLSLTEQLALGLRLYCAYRMLNSDLVPRLWYQVLTIKNAQEQGCVSLLQAITEQELSPVEGGCPMRMCKNYSLHHFELLIDLL